MREERKMNMKKIIYTALAAICAVACVQPEGIKFSVDTDTIEMGAAGGVHKINVSSADNWVATTEAPWITVSPANGRGSAECQVIVDSTLITDQREGYVRIQNLADDSVNEFTVLQAGFEHQIVLEKPEVTVAEYAEYGSRSFDVKVKANVDFDVVLPEGASGWLSCDKSELVLDRGARPREVNVHFDWKVNSRDEERIADIVFRPVESGLTLARHDGLKVVQSAADPIPVGTAEGDSLSLLAINRALGAYIEWDTAEKMEHWDNVAIWKDGPNKGRVRYVQFFMFRTQESLPYEVQNLTAAEEISFFGNANQFLLSLDTGEYITKLTQLKRLTIAAYGLTTLHPDFVNLKNLEYLDLNSNCFQSVPEMLTPENFPNLRSLILNANKRNSVYDLSNDIRENIGGFIEDDLSASKGMERFKKLLKWDNLDTLRLSVNYLQGELPDMSDEGLPVWTFEELKDSLATGLTALPAELQDMPKVLPNAKFFAINHNRFYGKLPNWLLYHPNLDYWTPYSLVFSQEGKTRDGKNAGFRNEPTSLDYYYELYPNKKYNPNKTKNQ